MIEEILELGIDCVELGYDFTVDLLPGVQSMIDQKAVTVGSVHNYCPVPLGASMGHPELFTFADPNSNTRDHAIWHTRKTIEFAAEIGATIVVAHMGNVNMPILSRKMLELWAQGHQYEKKYEKTKIKMLAKRDKKAPRQIPFLYECIEKILPVLESNEIRLGIEILPTWEAIPTELELERLLQTFSSPYLSYWHDFGHSQIRQNLGLINHAKWLERLKPRLGGVHIHDVATPGIDHLMPPLGDMDFSIFKSLVNGDIPRVFEPSPRIPPDELKEGIRIVRESWA